jgi:hypothetical protein
VRRPKFLASLWVLQPMKDAGGQGSPVSHQRSKKAEDAIAHHRRLYEYVCKENDLLNHRTTWFLAIQTAVIFGFSVTLRSHSEVLYDILIEGTEIAAFVNNRAEVTEALVFWLLCCALGWLSANGAGRSIRAGIIAQQTLSRFWDHNYAEHFEALGLPRLMGGYSSQADREGAHFADSLAKTMWWGWGGLTVLLIVLLVRAGLP